MDVAEFVRDRMCIFKNLYDSIRIVDPANKKTYVVSDEVVSGRSAECFSLWERGRPCENCVSMRAFLEKDTFVKIELDHNRVYVVTASPVEIDGNTYIVEMLKDISQYGAIIKDNQKLFSLESLLNDMNNRAIKDGLTGIYNRRYLGERLASEFSECKSSGHSLTLIAFDIDGFNKINYKYGYNHGDKLLKDFSGFLSAHIDGSVDWLARYGEDKFIMVLSKSILQQGYMLAERIRKSIQRTSFMLGETIVHISISACVLGINQFETDIDSILSCMDKNIGLAKERGGNTTVLNYNSNCPQ